MADTSGPYSEEVVIANDVGDWYIIDYENPSDDLRLSVAMESLVTPRERDTGTNYPLPVATDEKVYPIVETSSAVRATRFDLVCDFLGEDGYELLMRHRRRKKSLLLQSPYGEQWWFVFGPNFDVELRSTTEPWRFVTMNIIEVVPVEGTGVFTENSFSAEFEELF